MLWRTGELDCTCTEYKHIDLCSEVASAIFDWKIVLPECLCYVTLYCLSVSLFDSLKGTCKLSGVLLYVYTFIFHT